MEIQPRNRAERRRLEKAKAKATKTYTLTVEQIDAMKKKAAVEATYQSVIAMLGLPLMVLMDKYGFRKKRLTAFTEKWITLFEGFEQGYFSVDDMRKTIKDETGYDIVEIGEQIHIFNDEEDVG